MKIKNILLVIIIGLLIIISTQNIQEVNVKLIFWEINISLIILIYINFVISFALGVIYSGMRRAYKTRKEKKRLKKEKKLNPQLPGDK
jgi:uncharacterized integral membrane protein